MVSANLKNIKTHKYFLPTLIWSISCRIVRAPDRTIAITNTGVRGLFNTRGLFCRMGLLGGRGLFCEKALLGGGGGICGQLKKYQNPQVLFYLP